MAKRTGPCSEQNCDRPVVARGLCGRHYQRLRFAGGVAANPRPNALERFKAKVVINAETGCHEWTACRVKKGYGRFGPTPGLVVYAHRWAYETFVGTIPPGLEVLHHCDNPRCVFADPDPEVSHLYVGTQQNNMDDMHRRGRGRWGPELAPCGTDAAATRHRKHGEPMCDACREAARATRRERTIRDRERKKRGDVG